MGGERVRTRAIVVGVLLAGSAAGGSSWVQWDPRDPVAVEGLEKALRADDMAGELEEYIEFDPLSVVPDERFRAAFPQLNASDVRVEHCQFGSPGGGVAILEFTPEKTSEVEVQRKVVRCHHDPARRASRCELIREVGYHLGDPGQAFRVSDKLDRTTALALMRLLASGSFRSEVPDFPPTHWPDQWWSQNAGRYLEPAVLEPGPNRFELSLAGCACKLTLVLEYGSNRTRDEVLIVGRTSICI